MIAIFFSSLIRLVPYPHLVTAGLIAFLSVLIYFEIFKTGPGKMEERMIGKKFLFGPISRLVMSGFVVSFITLIDDSVILLPLFVSEERNRFGAVIGIYAAALLQVLLVIFFGGRLQKIKYKKEIASGSLIVLALLIVFRVV